jgi:hypothetical protein
MWSRHVCWSSRPCSCLPVSHTQLVCDRFSRRWIWAWRVPQSGRRHSRRDVRRIQGH